MTPLHDLRVAVGFLTRVPVGDVSYGGQRTINMASAVPWFAIVGASVGLAVGGTYFGLAQLVAPFVAAAIAVGLGLLVTGAFHHDGLADMADAFGGGWTVEQRFEILKDSRLGTYGTCALGIALLTEVGLLASLGPGDGLRALVAAHALGRTAAQAVMIVAPVAGDGLGAAYTQELSTLRVGVGAAIGLAIAATVSPVLVIWPVLGAVAASSVIVFLSIRKIGGVTGDVLGAIAVCASLAALFAVAVAL